MTAHKICSNKEIIYQFKEIIMPFLQNLNGFEKLRDFTRDFNSTSTGLVKGPFTPS